MLRKAERPDPRPAEGRVRVRIHAATVNPVDLWTRAGSVQALTPGLTPPFLLGWDLAGTVLEDASGFTAGQRVVGMVPWFGVAKDGIGTYAEIVSALPGWLAPLPDGADLAAAATLGLNAQTAAQSLDLLGLGAGQTVLVTGASGGVGGFAVELAAAAGAHVVALAGGPDDEAYLAGLGAKQVLPRTAPESLAAAVRALHSAGVDAVLDAATLGQPVVGAVADGGRFVSTSAPAPEGERGIRVQIVQTEPDGARLAGLVADLAAGRLTTRVRATLPLAQAAEAHRRAAASGQRGKIVLLP
ncbi:MAG TPA: NADP-dependent oxidoreductase [Mycobacteriales bacterium]